MIRYEQVANSIKMASEALREQSKTLNADQIDQFNRIANAMADLVFVEHFLKSIAEATHGLHRDVDSKS